MLHIREYRKGDEQGIIDLFNEIYTFTRDEDYWSWLYEKNPCGQPIIVVAEDEGKIIGHYAMIMTIVNIDGKETLSGQAIDAMISKTHRGKGIFEDMVKKVNKIALDKGIILRVGFPTNSAMKTLTNESIGSVKVTNVPLFIRQYKLDSFFIAFLKIKPLGQIVALPANMLVKFLYREKKIKAKENYQIKEINLFDSKFDDFWEKIKGELATTTKRSSEFLNWRLSNHPKNKYITFASYLDDKVVGYMTIKVEERPLKGSTMVKLATIIDMLALDDTALAGLYYRVKSYLKENNVDFIVSWAEESMKYRQLLIDLGFFKTRSNMPFVIKALNDDKEMEEYLSSEKNWYVAPVESDIY